MKIIVKSKAKERSLNKIVSIKEVKKRVLMFGKKKLRKKQFEPK